MQKPFELVIEAHPDSLFCTSKIYRKLYFASLVKQGFHSCIILAEQELSDFDQEFSFKQLTRRAWTENRPPLAEKLIFISDQNFVCLGLKMLLQDSHSCTLGLRLAINNYEYPYFDSKACIVQTRFFDDKWIDAYEYAGVLACESSLFLKIFCSNKSNEEVIRSLTELCTPTTYLLSGFMVQQDYTQLKSYLSLPIKPCLFLDRDGILNVDTGYPHKHDQFKAIDGIIPIIQWAKSKSWWVVVVTNQAGLAKGVFKEEDYKKFSSYLKSWLAEKEVELDAWFHCPFHPDGKRQDLAFKSLKRKPYPGMVLEAMAQLPINLERSIIIGDKESDVLNIKGLNTLLIEGKYCLQLKNDVPKVRNHEQALRYLQSNY
ncbi:MAG: D-glycero-alpha-D-manno-heptose-1,7-bisphosphate 7-phosphatase [Oligoflexales bacterium]